MSKCEKESADKLTKEVWEFQFDRQNLSVRLKDYFVFTRKRENDEYVLRKAYTQRPLYLKGDNVYFLDEREVPKLDSTEFLDEYFKTAFVFPKGISEKAKNIALEKLREKIRV